MVVVRVRLLVWCCICNITSFTSLTFVQLTIYGMCKNSILFYTNITSYAHGVKHITQVPTTVPMICESQARIMYVTDDGTSKGNEKGDHKSEP
jgi:hypothetical protein